MSAALTGSEAAHRVERAQRRKPFESASPLLFRYTGLSLTPARRRFRGAARARAPNSQDRSFMAFVQFTQPDD